MLVVASIVLGLAGIALFVLVSRSTLFVPRVSETPGPVFSPPMEAPSDADGEGGGDTTSNATSAQESGHHRKRYTTSKSERASFDIVEDQDDDIEDEEEQEEHLEELRRDVEEAEEDDLDALLNQAADELGEADLDDLLDEAVNDLEIDEELAVNATAPSPRKASVRVENTQTPKVWQQALEVLPVEERIAWAKTIQEDVSKQAETNYHVRIPSNAYTSGSAASRGKTGENPRTAKQMLEHILKRELGPEGVGKVLEDEQLVELYKGQLRADLGSRITALPHDREAVRLDKDRFPNCYKLVG